jgi:hypothetical protein
MELLRYFKQTLEEVRIRNAVDLANKQLKQIQDLALKSRSDIEAKGGFEKIASSEFLDAMIRTGPYFVDARKENFRATKLRPTTFDCVAVGSVRTLASKETLCPFSL